MKLMTGLRTFLKLIVLAPVAAIIILFAVANRAPVTISFDPLGRDAPAFTATLPIYLVVLAAIALGVVAGGAGAWLGQRRHRKAARLFRREAQVLRADVEQMKASVAARLPLPTP